MNLNHDPIWIYIRINLSHNQSKNLSMKKPDGILHDSHDLGALNNFDDLCNQIHF
jgi:hypothetical protein